MIPYDDLTPEPIELPPRNPRLTTVRADPRIGIERVVGLRSRRPVAEELEEFAASDPAVHAELLSFEVKTWYVTLSKQM